MIIVTSGHVDHGKTALLQALTGTHTAHLPEEKKRGMTIDLGYAYLPLAGKTLGFIDVPGHEKFLSNMLAGLGGVDYAMLIVAADEGVAAQTREHLAILQALKFREILVVITKADLVSSTQIDAVSDNIRQHYPFLATQPFFVTSAKSGVGIDALRQYLAALPETDNADRPFRYAIDRIFSVKGAGTVVTGTALAGKVNIDDEVFLSNGKPVRIKQIHAQNTPTETGRGGQRLALNIHTEADRTEIERGNWLFSSPPVAPTGRLTVQIEPQTALSDSQPVHVYHAASRTTGKLNLLQNTAQNDRTFAELILEKPLFFAFGDKLIVRSGDAKTLLGGAKAVDIYSPKRHKRTPERLAYLAALAKAQTVAERLGLYLQNGAVDAERLMWIEQLTEGQLAALLVETGGLRFRQWCFTAAYRNEKMQQILTALSAYHGNHNDQLGVSKARLCRMAAVNEPEKLIYRFIDQLLEDGSLQQTRGWLHLPDHKIQFSAEEQRLWQAVEAEFQRANGQPVWVRDMATALAQDETVMRNFLYKAGKLGYLTPIVKDRFFLTETLYTYAKLVKQILAEKEALSVNELRDRLGFGRKLTVQLTEYFDRCGLLRRRGNEHLLRDKDLFD